MTTVQPARRVDPLAPPAGLGVDSPTLPTAGAHALRRALAPHMQCLCGHGFAGHQVSVTRWGRRKAGQACGACEGQCPRWRSRQGEQAQMALAVAGELQAIAVAEVPRLVVAPSARCRGRHRRRR